MSRVKTQPEQSGNPEQPAWDETWDELVEGLTPRQQAEFVKAELDSRAEAESHKRKYHLVSSRPTT